MSPVYLYLDLYVIALCSHFLQKLAHDPTSGQSSGNFETVVTEHGVHCYYTSLGEMCVAGVGVELNFTLQYSVLFRLVHIAEKMSVKLYFIMCRFKTFNEKNDGTACKQ